MKTFFSNPWVIGAMIVAALVAIYYLFFHQSASTIVNSDSASHGYERLSIGSIVFGGSPVVYSPDQQDKNTFQENDPAPYNAKDPTNPYNTGTNHGSAGGVKGGTMY